MAPILSENGSLVESKGRTSIAASARKRPSALPKREEDLDELDLIVCHEEFESLVALVEKVKHTQELLRRASPSATERYERNKPSFPKSCLGPHEVLAAVERMRKQLSFTDITIKRGSHPVTDSTMDDNFAILRNELELCESCLSSRYPNTGTMLHRRTLVSNPQGASRSPQGSYRPSAAAANKYSKWQSDILLQWLVENHKTPTLSKPEIKELAQRTGLKPSQVSTWLQNMRRRRKKNTIEGTKKATHFLDFLFLAHERDKNGGALPKDVEIDGLSSIEEPAAGSAETPKRKRSLYEEYPVNNYVPYTPPVSSSSALSYDAGPPLPENIAFASTPHRPSTDGYSCSSANPALCKQDALDVEELSFTQDDSLFDGLQTVTESFEDSSIEPASINVDIDEDVLCVFASTWHDASDEIATPPVQVSSSAVSDGDHAPPISDQAWDEMMEWDDVDISPVSIFRKRIITAMVEGDIMDDVMSVPKQETREEL